MMTGSLGTSVISWTQTEVDGMASAGRSALGVGSAWRWTGEAVRVDGPQDVLVLRNAVGMAEERLRVSRKARKILGRIVPNPDIGPDYDDPPLQLGFDVTDGYQSYTATVVDLGRAKPPLLMFVGLVPPVDKDLWVVRAQMEVEAVNRMTEQPSGVICFTPGTRIRTERGDVAVEEIEEGDRVQTKDNGCQEVLWKGVKRVTGARLYAMPELRPIRLRAGALGLDRPDGDLLVSPAHRMLVTGAKARALFNIDEVLVSARDLVNDRTVIRDLTVTSVTYVHLLLPRHEVVFANGLETESFHPAGEALDSVDPGQRERLIGMMPDLDADPMAYGDYARRALNQAEAAIWASPYT